MRVIVDTNVFVSAALSGKSSPALPVYLAERRCILLKSTATEQEILQVVARPQVAHLIATSFLDRETRGRATRGETSATVSNGRGPHAARPWRLK